MTHRGLEATGLVICILATILTATAGAAAGYVNDDAAARGAALGDAVATAQASALPVGVQDHLMDFEPMEPIEFVPGEIIVKYRAERLVLCPATLARQHKTLATETGKADLDGLDRIHSQHGLNLAGARKLLQAQPSTGNLLSDRALGWERFEDIKRRFQARRIPAGSTFVDLSSIYVVPCAVGRERAAVEALRKNSNVEYAELNRRCRIAGLPDDTYVDPDQDGVWSSGAWGQAYFDLWGMEKIGANEAWGSGQTGAGIIVAVIDTGIDRNHEDIAFNVWVNEVEQNGIPGVDDDGNGYIDDIYGYDFAYADSDPADGRGHGTHCAGTIAAPINSIGVVGVAPRATVMAVKGLDDSGNGYDADLAEAVKYAADNGAHVLSNSWGAWGSSQTLTDAFHYAHALGCVCVAAAGNDSINVNMYRPAGIDTVMSVAATDYADQRASFSNWGSLLDVAAPGIDVLSLRASGTGGDNSMFVPPNDPDARYKRSDGTSMACPHVAGLAALALAAKPQLGVQGVRDIIQAKADDLGDPGFDIYYGHGRINVAATVAYLTDCNGNGIDDSADIAQGTSGDCNGNVVPDECEDPDCNGNGVPDTCDIADGTSSDCNSNGIPDECIGPERDCDGNGVPDECDIAGGSSLDADSNGVPDECQDTLYVPSPDCPTIQSAIDAAGDGDTILVAPGRYTGTGNKNLDFHGKILTLRSENGAATCSIDCKGLGRGLRFHSEEGPHARVEGFTIENGYADLGGGIYSEASSPTIVNCVITNCTTHAGYDWLGGGGVFCLGGSLTMTGCTVSANSAEGGGGGIAILSGDSPTINGCTVSDNTTGLLGGGMAITVSGHCTITDCLVEDNDAWRAGGMHCAGGTFSIAHCTISHNTASNDVGGIFCYGSAGIISNCTISQNAALETSQVAYYGGGGLSFNRADMVIRDDTISGNTAGGSGGGIGCSDNSNCVISHCAIADNTAGLSGGAIWCKACSPTIVHCRITANEARWGGGLYSTSSFVDMSGVWVFVAGSPTVSNCVIAANTATESGGGMYWQTVTSEHVPACPTVRNCTVWGNHASEGGGMYCNYEIAASVYNSILWGNSASRGRELYLWGTPCSLRVEHCDVKGGQTAVWIGDNATLEWGEGNMDSDPLFVDVDGPDGLAGTPDDNPRLLRTSPCIDAGSNGAVTVETDFYGFPRIRNGGSGEAVVDMGAVEYQPIPGDCNHDGSADLLDFPDFVACLTDPDAPLPPGCTCADFNADDDGALYDYAQFQLLFSLRPRLYVRHDATGTGTGQTWGDAFIDLQHALDVATPGSDIWVAAGTYRPDRETGDPGTSFILPGGVSIYGGFAGNELSLDERDLAANPTILNGDFGGENSYHVVYAENVQQRVLLDGFLIMGGHADAAGIPHNAGAGVRIIASSVALRNCVIRGNTADGNGGGISNITASVLRLVNCVISGNAAGSRGGGIQSYQSTLAVTNCTIANNASAAEGGGLFMNTWDTSLTNCILCGNTAMGGVSDESAQIHVLDGTLAVDYSCVQYWSGTFGGTGNIGLHPLFVDEDGPDGVAGTPDDNLRLLAMSPCIDAGSNEAVTMETDLDGHPRIRDGGSGEAIVDMGAYEYQPVPGDLDGDRDVDAADYAAFLAAFGHATGDPAYNPAADLDGDGRVTLMDYQLWLQAYRDFVGDPNAAPPTLPGSQDPDPDDDAISELEEAAEAVPIRAANPGPRAAPCAIRERDPSRLAQ